VYKYEIFTWERHARKEIAMNIFQKKSRLSLKHGVLYVFIISIILSAALGISALLTHWSHPLGGRLLLSSLTLASGSMCFLTGAALWELQRQHILAIMGMGLASVSSVLLLLGLWQEINSDYFWQWTASLWAFTFATAHVCLLNFARLRSVYVIALYVAVALIYALALLISMMIFNQFQTDHLRLLAILAILVSSFSLLIPIFHRLSADPHAPEISSPGFCPFCATPLSTIIGKTICSHCNKKFLVRLLPS
jgi:hypothetical protein